MTHRPGPGQPSDSKTKHRANRHDVGKTVRYAELIKPDDDEHRAQTAANCRNVCWVSGKREESTADRTSAVRTATRNSVQFIG